MRTKQIIVVVIVLGLLWLLAGCSNTCRGFGGLLRGAGQTVEGVGTDIQEAVDNQQSSEK